MIFEGVMMHGGICTEDDNELTGVEQNATLWLLLTDAWLEELGLSKLGKDGIEA